MSPARRAREIDEGHEVVVVGARCAGAATAMLLARQGHDVLVVDRTSFPSDTLSTHLLCRGGVVQLARWGVLDAVLRSGAPKLRTSTLRSLDGTTRRRAVAERAGIDFLVAPRRDLLDTILLTAAIDAGARFTSGLTVTGTVADASGRASGVTARDRDGRPRRIPASFVVGADGVRSRIARAVGAQVVDGRRPAGAAHYAYVAELDRDGVEYHVGPQSFAGVFPTHGGEANVWVCTPAADVAQGPVREERFLDLLGRASPPLAARVRSARITTPVRGAIGYPNHVREGSGPGWALVGDAGYHRDPITGHGITDAFRDAEVLARHLGATLRQEVAEQVALAAYRGERDRALATVFDLTVRMSEFPPPSEFEALLRQVSRALDDEAEVLAGLPPLPAAGGAAA